MRSNKISLQQLMALLFAALLSPAVTVLPGDTAAIAGGGAWLAPLFALPAVLALCWVVRAVFRRLPVDVGLAEALEAAFGITAGRIITGAYLMWCLFVLISNASLCGQRLMAAGYRNASFLLFLAALLVLVLWLGWGKLTVFARAGEIFFLALTVMLGGAVFLSLFHIKKEFILPLWIEDVPLIAVSAVPVLKVLSYAVFTGFLGGRVTRRPTDARQSVRWIAAFCGALTLLLLAVLGQFGPTLTAAMEEPFFQMAAGVGIRGAFQRLEAAVSAFWVFGDLALLGLLTFACRAMAASAFRLKYDKWAVIPVGALTFFGALNLYKAPPMAAAAAAIGRTGSLILTFGVLPFVLLALEVRSRK